MKNNKGFTLIELLVGVIIGLFILLAAYSSSLYFSKTSRSSIGINNATQNGAIGLYSISQDIRQAGLGLTSSNVVMCDRLNMYYNNTVIANNERIGPVLITDGDNDTIAVQYSNSIRGGAAAQTAVAMASQTGVLTTNPGARFVQGDVIIVSNYNNNSPCTIMNVSSVGTSTFGTTLAHASGPAFLYNPASVTTVFTNSVSYPAGSLIANYNNPVWRVYSVENNELIMTNRITNQSFPIVDNVVGMQAQYGVTASNNTSIDSWVDATGEWSSDTIDLAHIIRIRAIRMSILVKSPQYEKPDEKGAECNTTNELPKTWTGGGDFTAMSDSDWKCYRYKSLNMVIPVKNLIYSYN